MSRPRNDLVPPVSPENLDIRVCERILACSLRDVIGDLCLADADIIKSYVAKQLHGNMNEIVTSSTELFFKNDTLTYARAADFNVGWTTAPNVVLDMEFAHGPVSVFFKLVLGDKYAAVEIVQLVLSEHSAEDLFDAAAFALVLASARLQPLSRRFMHLSHCLRNVTQH